MKKIMKSKISIITILLVGVLIAFSGQGIQAEDFPVTIEDDLGEKIELNEKPEKIISLAPSMTEMLYSLGLGDRVVGVSSYADYPEEATQNQKIGSVTDPNVEKIVSLKPDLVLAASVNKMEYVEKLKSVGITVAGFNPTTIEETINTMNKVGILTGEEYLAKELTKKMNNQLKEIEKLVAEKLKENDRPDVFYEIWHDPLTTAGEGTFIDDLIQTAGGRNLGALAEGSWPQFDMETMLVENPEVYISSHHSDAHTFTKEGLKERPNYSALNAVKNDRIYFIEQNIVTRPSPRIILGLKDLVKSIWPDLKDQVEGI
ncbi:MAG: ABC transporter substrate-binding protein [Bacillota bacterium]